MPVRQCLLLAVAAEASAIAIGIRSGSAAFLHPIAAPAALSLLDLLPVSFASLIVPLSPFALSSNFAVSRSRAARAAVSLARARPATMLADEECPSDEECTSDSDLSPDEGYSIPTPPATEGGGLDDHLWGYSGSYGPESDMVTRSLQLAIANEFARNPVDADQPWISLENDIESDADSALATFERGENRIDRWVGFFLQRGAFSPDAALAAAEFRDFYSSAQP